MSTEYYIVDFDGRRVLDIGKAYWLYGVVGEATAEDIEQAAQAALPDEPWAVPDAVRIARWIREVAGGRAHVCTEHGFDDGYPWHDPRWTRYDSIIPRDVTTGGGERWIAWLPEPDDGEAT